MLLVLSDRKDLICWPSSKVVVDSSIEKNSNVNAVDVAQVN